MSEDEAFVRAIVDGPGDDLPRLVYADWLDDRDDPRGPYLRAEREEVETGNVARLRELAAGLDPVWVARVSRPPVGVCCGTRELRSVGSVMTVSDLNRFETEIGLPLTGDYRAFVLNTNGRVLSATDDTAANWTPREQCLYSLDFSGPLPDHRSLLFHTRRFRSLLPSLSTTELLGGKTGDEPWFADSLPIGDSGNDYFTLFYAVRGKHAGRLHLHDYTGEWCRFGWLAGPHGPPTLAEFLHRLPQNGWSIADTYPSQPLQEFWKA